MHTFKCNILFYIFYCFFFFYSIGTRHYYEFITKGYFYLAKKKKKCGKLEIKLFIDKNNCGPALIKGNRRCFC